VTASIVHLSRLVAAFVTLIFGVIAVVERDAHWLVAAGLCFLVWAVFSVLHLFEAARERCALCSGTLFMASGNAKHPRARGFLGSYPLSNAFGILTKGVYRCQHCGEEISCRSGRCAAPALSQARCSPPAAQRRVVPAGRGHLSRRAGHLLGPAVSNIRHVPPRQ